MTKRRGAPHHLGARLRQLRQARRLSRRELADLIGVSQSYLSYIERGLRRPSAHVLARLATAVGASHAERAELDGIAGHPAGAADTPEIESMLESLARELAAPGVGDEERRQLFQEIRAAIAGWEERRRARQRQVRKAVILAAGWQPRLLSTEQVTRTLRHAIEEASAAAIHDVFVVVDRAMDGSGLRALQGRRKRPAIHPVVQERQLGMAHGILRARDGVGHEPFAVLLPDDIDPARSATRELVDAYRRAQGPLLAVERATAKLSTDVGYYGVAILGDRLETDGRVRSVRRMREKPGPDAAASASWRILGRYILTPDVFDAIDGLEPNRDTGELELTDALTEMSKRHGAVYAFDLGRSLLPLAPVRALIERLVDAIETPRRFHRILAQTREILDQIDRS